MLIIKKQKHVISYESLCGQWISELIDGIICANCAKLYNFSGE